tara:strand:- start:1078 stop:1266 length:189 start_codon:yes stop_codon:yes gene_type:complete
MVKYCEQYWIRIVKQRKRNYYLFIFTGILMVWYAQGQVGVPVASLAPDVALTNLSTMAGKAT